MSNFLSFLLAASAINLPFTPVDLTTGDNSQPTSCTIPRIGYEQYASLDEIKNMLYDPSSHLSASVINKVLTTLKCSSAQSLPYGNVLTIIDYSLPSNQKRLWVFDMQEKKLLFNTYVAHGIKSGTLLTDNFSNKYNSKASSYGIYKTEKAYYGREGLSLRLGGLDRSFNDNASNRSIVMHGGWYVEEPFIKKYGRPGRSWGCPALPHAEYQAIINTIKDDSLMVVYYPDENWFNKSKFLNCEGNALTHNAHKEPIPSPVNELREDILLAGVNKAFKSESNEAVVTVKADRYEQLFHTKAPLDRMLRRQIDNMEYIALSDTEFNQMFITKNPELKVDNQDVYFVIPVLKSNRGYYQTLMHIVDFGKIKEVRLNANSSQKIGQTKSYTVLFEGKPAINLHTTNRFIRWLGL